MPHRHLRKAGITAMIGGHSTTPVVWRGRNAGAGVICNGIPFEILVIPAKAGIQSVGGAFPMACGVDSRFRGNDCTWERPCLANDTSTEKPRTSHGGGPRYAGSHPGHNRACFCRGGSRTAPVTNPARFQEGASRSAPTGGVQARVRTIRHLRERFCLPVGYTDNNCLDKPRVRC